MRTRRAVCLVLSLILIPVFAGAQRHDDWTGFEFKPGPINHKGIPEYLELQRDYTVTLPEYFDDATKISRKLLEVGWSEDSLVGFFHPWASGLPITDWDFVSLEPDGLLRIKKGYRWDGASLPCKRLNGCAEKVPNYRSSLVHDALYDLMRLERHLEADTTYADHGFSPLFGCVSVEKPDILPGDRNRHLADMVFFMIQVDDGRPIDNAASDYRVIRDLGPCKTEDGTLLNPWKFHPSQLTAVETDDGIELTWQKRDNSDLAPLNEYSKFHKVTKYGLYRTDAPLNIVDMDVNEKLIEEVDSDAQSAIDSSVVSGTKYRYRLKAISIPSDLDLDAAYRLVPPSYLKNFPDSHYPYLPETPIVENQAYWSNDDIITPVVGAGNALRMGQYGPTSLEADTVPNMTPDLSFSASLNIRYMTLEAWVYPEPGGADEHIITLANPDDVSDSFSLMYCGSQEKFCLLNDLSNNDPIDVASTESFPAGKWHHVAMSLQGGYAQLYVNGIRQGFLNLLDAYRFTPVKGAEFTIGSARGLANSQTSNFKGIVDEVRTWRGILTEDEIREGMCKPINGLSDDDDLLLALWKFDSPVESEVDSSQCEDIPPELVVDGDKNTSKILERISGQKRDFCTAQDATVHGNDAILRGYGSIKSKPQKPFVKSHALFPSDFVQDLEIGLDKTGFAQISASQIAPHTNACVVRTVLSRGSVSCDDIGNPVAITVTAIDMEGDSWDETATVTVSDDAPPEVSDVVTNHQVISSTSGGMVTVTIDGATVNDNCESLGIESCEIVEVTASEPLNRPDSSNPDYEKTGPLTVNLRAISSPGHQRRYALSVRCKDSTNHDSEISKVYVTVGAGNGKSGTGATSALWLVLLLLVLIRQHCHLCSRAY